MRNLIFMLMTVFTIAIFVDSGHAQQVADSNLQAANATGMFDAIDTRIISDPLFLPLKGQVYGSTRYYFYRTNYDMINASGHEIESLKTDDNQLYQSFEYGLTDALSISLSDAFDDFRHYDTIKNSDAKTISATDPTFGATYRVLDQSQYPVDFDLNTDYTPNVISARSAGGNKIGNFGNGYQEFDVKALVGREMKNLTVDAFAESSYDTTEHDELLSDDHKYKHKEGASYDFGVESQTRFLDRWSVNLGIAYYLQNNNDGVDTATGFQTIQVPGNYWDFDASLNYQIIPDILVGRFLYNFHANENTHYLYPSTGSNETQTKHWQNGFGLEFSYLFNIK